MSRIKTLVAEDYDATQGHIDPVDYPGEEEAAFEALAKQSMLDNFTTEELQDEVWRRTMEPLNNSLEELKFIVSHFGEDKDMPF